MHIIISDIYEKCWKRLWSCTDVICWYLHVIVLRMYVVIDTCNLQFVTKFRYP